MATETNELFQYRVGRLSRMRPFASFFYVGWDLPESKLRDVVLIPVLGDHYGRILEAGELRLRYQGGNFTVHYYDHVLPVAPESLALVLRRAAKVSGSEELAFA